MVEPELPTFTPKTVGKIKLNRVTSKCEGHHYYRCTWEAKFSMKDKAELKSPKFTIPLRNSCKWYLSAQRLNEGPNGELYFSVRLHLDPLSECKSADAKYKLKIDDWKVVSGHSSSCDYFRFVKNSTNWADTISMVHPKELQRYYDSDDEDDENEEYFGFTVLCTMMILKVRPEDDSFPNDFESLLREKKFTDVTILAGPWKKKFLAHKAILSARSSVFAAMFAHNTTENEGVVIIKEIYKEVMDGMLNYIYTGEIEGYEDLAQDLLIAADKYDLKGLKRRCEGILIDSLSCSNVLDLVVFAETHKASYLKYEAAFLFWNNKTELTSTKEWKKFSKSNAELAEKISLCDFHLKPMSDSGPDDTQDCPRYISKVCIDSVSSSSSSSFDSDSEASEAEEAKSTAGVSS